MSRKHKKPKRNGSSPQRVAANQQNARHSTGPKTPEGKAASSRNAMKWGVTGKDFNLLPWEHKEEWAEFEAAFLRELAPSGVAEAILVRRVAEQNWLLDRCQRMHTKTINDASNMLEMMEDLNRVMLYASRIQRGLDKTLAEFRRVRDDRLKGLTQPTPNADFLPLPPVPPGHPPWTLGGPAIRMDMPRDPQDGREWRYKLADMAYGIMEGHCTDCDGTGFYCPHCGGLGTTPEPDPPRPIYEERMARKQRRHRHTKPVSRPPSYGAQSVSVAPPPPIREGREPAPEGDLDSNDDNGMGSFFQIDVNLGPPGPNSRKSTLRFPDTDPSPTENRDPKAG